MNDVQKIIDTHYIVDIDDYIHIVDGKCICYEADVIDFTDMKQVQAFFNMVDNLFSEPLLKDKYPLNETRAIITGTKSVFEKSLSFSSINDFPEDILEKVRGKMYGLSDRTGC